MTGRSELSPLVERDDIRLMLPGGREYLWSVSRLVPADQQI